MTHEPWPYLPFLVRDSRSTFSNLNEDMFSSKGFDKNINALVWQLNLRNSRFAFDIVMYEAKSLEVDILLLSDPPNNIKNESISTPGFKLYSPCVPSQERQCALLIKEDILSYGVYSNHGRMCGAYLSDSLAVLCCYVRHTDANGLSEVCSLYESLRHKGCEVLLGGDFNSKHALWGPADTHPNTGGRFVEEWISKGDVWLLNQFPCIPTFENNNQGKSWIDLTLCSPGIVELIDDWIVSRPFQSWSDHNLISFFLRRRGQMNQAIDKLNWKKCDWDSLLPVFRSKNVSQVEQFPMVHG